MTRVPWGYTAWLQEGNRRALGHIIEKKGDGVSIDILINFDVDSIGLMVEKKFPFKKKRGASFLVI